jgi:AsmA protein
MASLNGHFVANIQDVQMAKTYLSQFGAGLLSQVNPLSSDTTTLECAIARLDFTDGIVNFENKIAAQTTEVTWLGGGEINLHNEELELGLAPKARKVISSMTDLGLASLVHVGGTLAEPEVGLDKKDVAKKYAQYSIHIATGGLSFLAQKANDNRVSNIDHCKRILVDMEKE